MRILFVTPYIPSRVRVRPYALIRELAELGHQVHLVCLVQPPWEAPYLEQVRPYCHSAHPIMINRAESYLNLLRSLPNEMPLSVAYCRSSEFKSQVHQLAQSRSFDLLHTEFIRAVPATAEVKGLPKVVDLVDSLGLAYQRSLNAAYVSQLQRLLSRIEFPKIAKFEAQALSCYDRWLISSPVDQAYLVQRNGGHAVEVLPNGVDLDYFAFSDAERRPERLIFLGKMSYYVNVASALWFYHQVLPLVHKERPGVILEIVGRNPSPQIKALSCDPRVEVTGTVADVRPHLYRAGVTVCPMVGGSGIQNKVLEAMACGTPVVATPMAIQALQVKSGVHLLIGESAQQFAGHVLELTRNDRLRRELSHNARQYIEQHHDWGRITQQLERTYIDLLKDKGRQHG